MHSTDCDHEEHERLASSTLETPTATILGRSGLSPDNAGASGNKHRHGKEQEKEQKDRSSSGDDDHRGSKKTDVWEGSKNPLDALEAAISLTQVGNEVRGH